MADKENGSGRGQPSEQIDYAPEWVTKSIDKVPPSSEPLADNPVVDAILGISQGGDGQATGPSEQPDGLNNPDN